MDILLFIIIWSLADERRRVQIKAEKMTVDLRRITRRLELAQASTGIGYWELEPRQKQLIWDDLMLQLYDINPIKFQGSFTEWQQCIHPDDRKFATAAINQLIDNPSNLNTQFRIVHCNGNIRFIETHAISIPDHTGAVDRVVGINLDITERKAAENRLALAAKIFQHAHEGIIVTDTKKRIIDINPTFENLTGYNRDEVIGKTPKILSSNHHAPLFYINMWSKITQDGYWQGEIWNRRKNGNLYAELLTISTIKDQKGNHINYVGVFTDITALKQQQSQLEQMELYDALTNLPNRISLAQRMEVDMLNSLRSNLLMAVCYLDLDDFKQVNDNYGHDIGDQLLIQVSNRLNSLLRAGDFVARIGGDEFVLLICDLKTVYECEKIVEQLLQEMTRSYYIAFHEIAISASVGITLFPTDNSDADTLLRHADQVMYQAKQGGRKRFLVFDSEQDRQTREYNNAITQIEIALQANEFVLYYQPKVDMRRGIVLGAEALIRWKHPTRGLLFPNEFLPKIEHTDFAIHLGDWVLNEAMRQLAAWGKVNFKTTVSVNISAQYLQQQQFVERLKHLLEHYCQSVLPSQLELEILETTALDDVERASKIINQCRALGVSVAIDDFGTGYSSLIYLKRLPADILKIDQSFIRNMLRDPEDLAIIEGIIWLSQAVNRKVIAEGVESEEHGVILLNLGCDLGQGYGIARPMPAEDFITWTKNYSQHQAWSDVSKNLLLIQI